jgi:hypothetical protein
MFTRNLDAKEKAEFDKWLDGADDPTREAWGESEAAQAGQAAMMGLIGGG